MKRSSFMLIMISRKRGKYPVLESQDAGRDVQSDYGRSVRKIPPAFRNWIPGWSAKLARILTVPPGKTGRSRQSEQKWVFSHSL